MAGYKQMAAAGFFLLMGISAAGAAAIRQNPSKQYIRSGVYGIVFQDEGKIADMVQKSLKQHDRRITLTFYTEGEYMGDISLLVEDLMMNALNIGDKPTDGDYIRYQYGGYTLSYSHIWLGTQYCYTIEIEPIYYTTPKQEIKTDLAVKEVLNKLDFGLLSSDYEKIRKIHDYLYCTVTYDIIHQNNENYHLDTTAYAALINRTARCQGYSVAAYRLLREAGIDCRIVKGTVEHDGTSQLHAWNLVKLNGAYYNMDITWDKLLETDDYFLKSDHSMPDHIRDSEYDAESFRNRYPVAENDY